MAVVCRSKGQRVASSEVQGGLVARRPGGVLRSGEPAPEARADRRARTAVPLLPEKGKPRLDPSIPSPGGKCKLQCSRLLLHLLPTYAPTPTASVNRSPTADTTQTPRYSYEHDHNHGSPCLIIASVCANPIPVNVGNCEPQRAQLQANARSKLNARFPQPESSLTRLHISIISLLVARTAANCWRTCSISNARP